MNKKNSKLRMKSIGALFAIPLLAGSLAACSPVSSSNSAATSTTAGKVSSSVLTFDEWQIAFAKCLREQGVDAPDPSASGGGVSLGGGGDEAAMNTAAKTCSDKLGQVPAPPGGKSQEESKKEVLQVAKCLRENGFDVPDPGTNQAMGIPQGASPEILKKCGINPPAGMSGTKSSAS